MIANEHRVLILRNYTVSLTTCESRNNWGAILRTSSSFRSLNMAARRIKLHISDISIHCTCMHGLAIKFSNSFQA